LLYVILRNPDRANYQLPELATVDQKTVSKIEISKADDTVVLKRNNDQWHIEPKEYLANDDMVSDMLDAVEEITLTALVSESKSYERYDLGDKKKISIKAWAGETLKRDFDVGKTASSFRHTFVKLADDSRVYHVRGDLRRKFDKTTDDLRDKTVLSFEKDMIEEIQLADGKKPVMVLSRIQVPVDVSVDEAPGGPSTSDPSAQEKTVWQTPDGKQADEVQIDQLLNALSNLRCENYIDDKKQEDLSNPIYVLQLKGQESFTLSLFEKKEKEESYPAVSSYKDYPFVLRQWQVNNIMKKPETLLKDEKDDQTT
jgi:hypothetical protein